MYPFPQVQHARVLFLKWWHNGYPFTWAPVREMWVKATIVERGSVCRSRQPPDNLTARIDLQNQHRILTRDVGIIGGGGMAVGSALNPDTKKCCEDIYEFTSFYES